MSRLLTHFLTVIGGAIAGWLIFEPVYQLPASAIPFFKPVLLLADQASSIYSDALVVAAAFLTRFPNTIGIALISSMVISRIARKRLFIYAALACPLYFYAASIWNIFLLEEGAKQIGMSVDVGNPARLQLAMHTYLSVLSYGLFLFILIIAQRLGLKLPKPLFSRTPKGAT